MARITSVPDSVSPATGFFPEPLLDPRIGIPNVDYPGNQPEAGLKLPWFFDSKVSWLAYEISLDIDLDAGMALHKPLPQSASGTVDTLASSIVSPLDPKADSTNAGPNLVSATRYADALQKMATSTYLFFLRGRAARAGYRIPCPGLRSVAGVPATPAERQFYSSRVSGNFGGIPVFTASWDLWYYVSVPPVAAQDPPPNMAMHIRADQELPETITLPVSPADSSSVTTSTLRRRLLR